MTDIESFFGVVAREVAGALEDLETTGEAEVTRHWLLIHDSQGVALAEQDQPARPVHEALGSLVDSQGAIGAAYVTYSGGVPEGSLVAYAVVRGPPRDSDVRSASIRRSGEAVSIGPWEHTV